MPIDVAQGTIIEQEDGEIVQKKCFLYGHEGLSLDPQRSCKYLRVASSMPIVSVWLIALMVSLKC